MSATRYSTKEKAAIEIYGKSNNFIAKVENVSMTGACLTWTDESIELSKGDLLRVTIVLKAMNRKHNLNAEVIWKDGLRTGVNFIKSEEVLEKMTER